MSTIPPWMPEPPAPQPRAGGGWHPHVIGQVPDGKGNVLVTFALPGLRRGTVRVPQSAWMAGEHLHIPPALIKMLPPVDPPVTDHGASQVESAADNPDG